MNCVVLALGSNKQYEYDGVKLSSLTILQNAVEHLQKFISELTASSLYITKPMYVEDQSNFHNMAVLGFYSGSPESLLTKTQEIEKQFGRDRDKEFRNGPRSLDIDILLFSDVQVSTDMLEIPHPKIEERAFVLFPMVEILDNYADSNIRDYYNKCLQTVNSNDVIKKIPFMRRQNNGTGTCS